MSSVITSASFNPENRARSSNGSVDSSFTKDRPRVDLRKVIRALNPSAEADDATRRDQAIRSGIDVVYLPSQSLESTVVSPNHETGSQFAAKLRRHAIGIGSAILFVSIKLSELIFLVAFGPVIALAWLAVFVHQLTGVDADEVPEE